VGRSWSSGDAPGIVGEEGGHEVEQGREVKGTSWTYILAILILVSSVKKALANCSPSVLLVRSANLSLYLTSES